MSSASTPPSSLKPSPALLPKHNIDDTIKWSDVKIGRGKPARLCAAVLQQLVRQNTRYDKARELDPATNVPRGLNVTELTALINIERLQVRSALNFLTDKKELVARYRPSIEPPTGAHYKHGTVRDTLRFCIVANCSVVKMPALGGVRLGTAVPSPTLPPVPKLPPKPKLIPTELEPTAPDAEAKASSKAKGKPKANGTPKTARKAKLKAG